MLSIYADTFMTATRSHCVELREIPAAPKNGRRRWFRRNRKICVEPAKL